LRETFFFQIFFELGPNLVDVCSGEQERGVGRVTDASAELQRAADSGYRLSAAADDARSAGYGVARLIGGG